MNLDELDAHFYSIGLKDSDFHLNYISNSKHLFSEAISPKNHGQLCLDIKRYQDVILVSFTATTPTTTTETHTVEQIFPPFSKLQNYFATKLRS